MPTVQAKGDTPESAENARKPAVKAKVKARHLSPLLRQMIVEQFAVRQSTEDVAEEIGVPVRTVDDVIKLHLMRKPPASAGWCGGARRAA